MNSNTKSRAIMATLAAALALTAVDMRPVAAASAPQGAQAKAVQASDATDFSSQRRHYGHGHYGHNHYRGGYRNGGAIAAGAILGTAAGLAIAGSARRGGYYDYGYQEPAYGYAQPYAPAPYYGSYGPRNEYFPN